MRVRRVEVRKRIAARGERVGRGKMSWIVGSIVVATGQGPRQGLREMCTSITGISYVMRLGVKLSLSWSVFSLAASYAPNSPCGSLSCRLSCCVKQCKRVKPDDKILDKQSHGYAKEVAIPRMLLNRDSFLPSTMTKTARRS